jgi:hypothetical protein
MLAPSTVKFAANGAAVAGLALVRPTGQVFLLTALVPLVLFAVPLRRRLVSVAAFAGVGGVLVASWITYNGVRYDDFAFSRTSVGAAAPFMRVWVWDRTVRPENGPSSKKLAAAVETDLLPRDPYRSRGVELEQFFASGSRRAWADLLGLSDRAWGWDSDYELLRDAAFEAIRAHPAAYVRGTAQTLKAELTWRVLTPAPREDPRGDAASNLAARPDHIDEGELVPASRLWWLASSPDGRVRQTYPAPRYASPADAAHASQVEAERRHLQSLLPSRDGSPAAARTLNALTRVYPPPWTWLVVGALVGIWRRPRGLGLAAVLAGLGILLLGLSALSVPIEPLFTVPVEPWFVLFAAVAILGQRRLAE